MLHDSRTCCKTINCNSLCQLTTKILKIAKIPYRDISNIVDESAVEMWDTYLCRTISIESLFKLMQIFFNYTEPFKIKSVNK